MVAGRQADLLKCPPWPAGGILRLRRRRSINRRPMRPVVVGKHILVTGCPRSGTTLVGRLLSLNRNVGYFDEPFKPGTGVEPVR